MVASKYCGQADPVFSGTLTGFLAGENITAAYSRTLGEAVDGLYNISAILNPSGKLGNYDITYNTAKFTIKGVNIDASASSAPVAKGTTALLSAKVTDALGNPVSGVTVKFYLDNVLQNVPETTPPTVIQTGANGVATQSISGLAVNVYQVKAVAGGGCNDATAYLAVYDPTGGFVTGGGWFNSPLGALVGTSAVGKANFGFVAKYKKGSQTLLEGETEFQFQAGGLNFKSSSLENMSLVVAGYKAIYKGQGSINGTPGYSFMVSAIDGNLKPTKEADRFRIKIWIGTTTIYDNQLGALENAEATLTLGGGSIVIHDGKGAAAVRPIAEITITEAQPNLTVKAYPTITSNYFNLLINSDKQEKIRARVTDLNGRTVETLNAVKGQVNRFGQSYINGMYFVEVIQGNERKVVKLVKSR